MMARLGIGLVLMLLSATCLGTDGCLGSSCGWDLRRFWGTPVARLVAVEGFVGVADGSTGYAKDSEDKKLLLEQNWQLENPIAIDLRNQAEALALDAKLYAGEVIFSGTLGTATLLFASGELLWMEPHTALWLTPTGAAGATLGAVVLSGKAEVRRDAQSISWAAKLWPRDANQKAQDANVLLEVGVPGQRVSLAGEEVRIGIEPASGVMVWVGAVQNRRSKGLVGEVVAKVQAGMRLTTEGLSVPLGPWRKDGETSSLGEELRLDDWVVPIAGKDTSKEISVSKTPKSRSQMGHGFAPIEVHAGHRTTLYYEGKPPILRFVAKSDAAKLEVVKNRPGFLTLWQDSLGKDKPSKIALSDKGWAHKALRPGRYRWKMHAVESQLVVVAGFLEDCVRCKERNIVWDTGERTVIYWQQTRPKIQLRWRDDAAKKQALYTVKLFAEGQLNDPIWTGETAENFIDLAEAIVLDGTYFWLVSAVDASSETASSPNALEVRRDARAAGLRLQEPKKGAYIQGNKVTSIGKVEAGSQVYINQKEAVVGRDGRFEAIDTLRPGVRRMIYRVRLKDDVEKIYVRRLKR